MRDIDEQGYKYTSVAEVVTAIGLQYNHNSLQPLYRIPQACSVRDDYLLYSLQTRSACTCRSQLHGTFLVSIFEMSHNIVRNPTQQSVKLFRGFLICLKQILVRTVPIRRLRHSRQHWLAVAGLICIIACADDDDDVDDG